MLNKHQLGAAAIALILGGSMNGCALIEPERTEREMKAGMKDLVEKVDPRLANPGEVREIASNNDLRASARQLVPTSPDSGVFRLQAKGSVDTLIQAAASAAGYSGVSYTTDVNRDTVVSVSLVGISPEAAIRRIAALAGYAAVLDPVARTVVITDEAVYTFRVPLIMTQPRTSKYSAGGDPSSSGGSGGNGQFGQPGGGGSSGATLKSDFTITGQASTDPETFARWLSEMAGKNAQVSVAGQQGLISVRGNGQALMRVRDVINRQARLATTRVEMEVTLAEVELRDSFEYGIDWTRILRNGTLELGIGGGAAIPGATFSTMVTDTNLNVLLQALGKYSSLRVLTRPKIVALHGQASQLADTESRPYLPTTSVSQSDASTLTSGSLAMAVQGRTLTFVPDVRSDDNALVTVLPVFQSLGTERTFDIGGATLVGLDQATRSAFMTIPVVHGRTTVIAGMQYSSRSNTRGGPIPLLTNILSTSAAEGNADRELAMLVTTRIIPGDSADTLIAESL